MSTGRARLPYINKDYDAIRQELVARIPQLTDRWTDFNESDLGIVLLELFAGIGDLLAYYLDAQAAECYLPTARRRQSIIDLCALVNYRLHGPVAATTRVRFTLGQPAGRDLTIPAGTVCQAQGASAPIPFETVIDLVITAGLADGEVNARQGERRTDSFTGSGTDVPTLCAHQSGGRPRHGAGDRQWGGLAGGGTLRREHSGGSARPR